VEKELLYTVLGNIKSTMEISMVVPQNTKNITTILYSFTTPGIYKGIKGRMLWTLHTMFIVALLRVSKLWSQHGCPSMDDGLRKYK
jgi:hypothetical protein